MRGSDRHTDRLFSYLSPESLVPPELLCALRRIGLAETQFALAICGTIRLKLLKLGALVRISVRRIKVAIASACPYQREFAAAHAALGAAAA